MSNFSMEDAADGTLHLTGELTIYTAADFKTALLNRLGQAQHLTVDLSGVSELDCAGLQVMLLARREAEIGTRTLQWEKHSPAVSQVLGVLNLGAELGLPVSLVWS